MGFLVYKSTSRTFSILAFRVLRQNKKFLLQMLLKQMSCLERYAICSVRTSNSTMLNKKACLNSLHQTILPKPVFINKVGRIKVYCSLDTHNNLIIVIILKMNKIINRKIENIYRTIKISECFSKIII